MIGLYRYTYKYTSPDTTSFTFRSPQVRRNQIVELTSASVADYTTANKKLVLGIEDVLGNQYALYVEQSSSKFESHMRGRVFLIEGDRVYGTVVSPTASDVLYFHVHGKVFSNKNMEVA